MSRRTFLDLVDPKPLVTSSRIAIGKRVRVRGIPAILVGVAAIVLSTGASRALARVTTNLPESLREARAFWLAVRGERRELPPSA